MGTKAKKAKKVKKAKKKVPSKVRYPGMAKVAKGLKTAWMSEQNKNGWSLGLALPNRTVWLRNTRFATKQLVADALGKNKVVFISLKNAK